MTPGIWILVAVFAGAAFLLVKKVRGERASEARLSALGFEPCEDEAPQILAVFSALAAGHVESDRAYQVRGCSRRRVESGFVYRFRAVDLSLRDRTPDEHAAVLPVSDVYLLQVAEGARAILRPCTLFFSSLEGGLFQRLLARLLALRPFGTELELPAGPSRLLCAFGRAAGKLDEHLSPSSRERLERAPAAGFFAAHFGSGRAAFLAPQGFRDVDAQWSFVAEWV
jgi:hypothetical protein